jgi:hypothetical protein
MKCAGGRMVNGGAGILEFSIFDSRFSIARGRASVGADARV